jgi:hypothetical protein
VLHPVTAMQPILPYGADVDQLAVFVKREAARNKNVGEIYAAFLKRGPRAVRIASIMEILNSNTGEHHHFQLEIWSFRGTKAEGWRQIGHSVRLYSTEEISALQRFAASVLERRLPERGDLFHLVDADDYASFAKVFERADEKAELLRTVFQMMDVGDLSSHDWLSLFQRSDNSVSRAVALAARLAEYEEAYEELRRLVENPDTLESELQNLLARHPWMFGSEYSELLDKRSWTRDHRLDFMVRRTADGYVEVVEIKRPVQAPLFRLDESHNSYFPARSLAMVLGQVMQYIGEVELNRAYIAMRDKEDPLKIRARVIVGRDSDEEQKQALRTLNSHLHGIEVLTFDHLLRIARRVLDLFQAQAAELSREREERDK